MNINFLVKANQQTGLGHIVRSLALADEFKARGHSCCFFTNTEAVERIRAAGHSFACIEPDDYPANDVWVVDLPLGIPLPVAQALRDKCAVLAVLNGAGHPDGDPGRLLADLVFYQGCTLNPYALSWDGFEGEWFEGAHWLILRSEFQNGKVEGQQYQSALAYRSDGYTGLFQEGETEWQYINPPHVVITGGGSDPKDVTGKVLEALVNRAIHQRVIIGPANKRDYTHYRVAFCFSPPNMAEALSFGDIAVISYGMTAFECLTLGVPTIALSISPDHVASAELVQERSNGALLSLGEVERVTAEDIRAAVKDALYHRDELSQKARAFCDGRGAERVADKILVETAL